MSEDPKQNELFSEIIAGLARQKPDFFTALTSTAEGVKTFDGFKETVAAFDRNVAPACRAFTGGDLRKVYEVAYQAVLFGFLLAHAPAALQALKDLPTSGTKH